MSKKPFFSLLKIKNEIDLGSGVFIALHLYLVFRPTEFVFFSTYFPIYAFALACIVIRSKYIKPNRDLLFILSCCVALTIMASINSIIHDFFDRRYLFNWLAWITIVFFVGYILRDGVNKSYLTYVAKIILIIQLFIAVTQLFEPHAFSFFWSSIKNRGLDHLAGVCGSFSSPIAFSSFVAYFVIWIISSSSLKKEVFWVVLALFMIIISGSRTMILIYPFIIGAWVYLEGNEALPRRITKAFLCVITLFVLTFLTLFVLKNTFVYAAELLTLLPLPEGSSDGGRYIANIQGHDALRTYGMRAEIWSTSFHEYYSKNTLEMLIGSGGAGYSTHTAHQDPLFVLTRYGFIGLAVYLSLLAYLLSLGYQNRETFEGKVVYLVSLLMIGIGTINTAGVEMRLGILVAIAAGLMVSKKTFRSAAIKIW